MTDEILEDIASAAPVDADDIKNLVEAICAEDASVGWKPDSEISLGSKRWRPSAVSSDSSTLLYATLLSEVPKFVADRLRLAREQGMEVCVALTISALFQPEILTLLADLDCKVLVVDDFNTSRRFERREFLAALADIEVPLSSEMRKALGQQVLSRLGDGTSQDKGRRLESLLAFLFSQVKDLKVVERNYRNETEEIDLVIQVDNFSSRVWQSSGVPFMLVEAKNRADKATQQMMSVLITKLQTKRGSAKIGVLVSLAGFTEDARVQELRFSTESICVVMIDREGVETLLTSDDLDEAFETMVRHALLR